MELGMIGLGRMGINMVRRLLRAGRVSDSAEVRWMIVVAIDESVSAPVLSAALYERFSSRSEGNFAGKVLSALRYQFGGHKEKAATKKVGA